MKNKYPLWFIVILILALGGMIYLLKDMFVMPASNVESAPQYIQTMANEISKEMGLNKNISIYISDMVGKKGATNNRIILINRNYINDTEELNLIITHELYHHKFSYLKHIWAVLCGLFVVTSFYYINKKKYGLAWLRKIMIFISLLFITTNIQEILPNLLTNQYFSVGMYLVTSIIQIGFVILILLLKKNNH